MESFQMSKDAGFKVVTHMMPDLPNVGMERDTEQFIVSVKTIDTCTWVHSMYIQLQTMRIMSWIYMYVWLWFLQEFFENPAFRPDGLKIYPTLVIRGTGKTFFSHLHVHVHVQDCILVQRVSILYKNGTWNVKC